MGAKKISALTAATLPLSGAERLCGVQAGATVGFAVDDLLATPFAAGAAAGEQERTLAARMGEVVNVKDFGAGSGDAAADTTAIKAAWTAGLAAPGAPHLYFPPGSYFFADDTLTILNDDSLLFGDAAVISFKGTGLWQVGATGDLAARTRFQGLRFLVDASSSVEAPLLLLNQSGTVFHECVFDQVNSGGVSLRTGEFRMHQCMSRMKPGGSGAVVKVTIATGDRASVFIQGGRYGGPGGGAAQYLVHINGGAGQLDGLVIQGALTSQLAGVVKCRPASGGKLSNCMAFGNLFDAVDPCAFDFDMPAGSVLGDVSIVGNKINGDVLSTATSGALVTVDLTGASTDDKALVVSDNVLNGARCRAFECLGGALTSLTFSGNQMTDYGRQANAASRAAYVAGTFDYLEVADNHGTTANTHDFDIEFGAVTATSRKVEGNSFSGSAPANRAALSTPLLRTRREVLVADRTYYVRTDGSDSNAGRVNSAAGAFLTLQGAYAVIGGLDFNGRTVTLQVADGTYTGGLLVSPGLVPSPEGGGLLIFQGNAVTPANVLISTTAADCFGFLQRSDIRFRVKDLKVQSTTSGHGVNVGDALECQIENVDFGTCASSHIFCGTSSAARVFVRNNYKISGSAPMHVELQDGGSFNAGGKTVTLTGTPAFSTAYASLIRLSHMACGGFNFTGSATGPRYLVDGNSVLYTSTDAGSGPNLSLLPGSASGTTGHGGLYL